MYAWSFSPAGAATVADATRAWANAFTSWGAVSAHLADVARPHADTPAELPAASMDAMARWQEEYALLMMRAWRDTGEAMTAGLTAASAPSSANLENNPFGLTGLFTSARAHAKAPASSPLSAAVAEAKTEAKISKKPIAKKPVAPKTSAPKTGAKAKPTAKAKPVAEVKEAAVAAKSKSTAAKPVKPGKGTKSTKTAKAAASGANTPDVPAKTAKKVKRAKVLEPNAAAPDDLTKIKGVGPKLQEALYSLGIFHYWQIAQMTKAEAEQVDTRINFPGRIAREKWISQAKALMADA